MNIGISGELAHLRSERKWRQLSVSKKKPIRNDMFSSLRETLGEEFIVNKKSTVCSFTNGYLRIRW